MSDVVYHMVHYREFGHEDPISAGKTLEELTRLALASSGPSGVPRWESIQDRLFPLPNSNGFELVLNRIADLSTAVFGEMCLIHSNGLQALLELTAKKHQLSQITLAEIYSLTETGAPTGSKYVRGLAYFLAVGKHLFFIRSQALTPAHIEEYFKWLITSPSGLLPPSAQPRFESKFDRSVVGNDIGDVKALRVSGPSFPQMTVKPASEKEAKERDVTRKVAEKFVQFGQAFELAKTLLGDMRARKLAESLGPRERLVVDATVKVRGSRTEESRARMKELASQLDGLTEGTITVEGKDGKFVDKDVILRTSMPFEVETAGATLLNFDNVADQLQTTYARFVEDKKIKA